MYERREQEGGKRLTENQPVKHLKGFFGLTHSVSTEIAPYFEYIEYLNSFSGFSFPTCHLNVARNFQRLCIGM